MLITDNFIYIHYPKTGGTFVTRVLEHLYGQSLININKHGTCREVPAEHVGKPLVTTLRHPLSRLLSHYKFRWWQRFPREDFGIWDAVDIKALYPSWPELTFPEYIALWNDHWIPAMKPASLGSDMALDLGIETYGFLEYYARDFATAITVLCEESDGLKRSSQIINELFPVRFLRMDDLNCELYTYLLSLGWDSSSLTFLLEAPRLCPGEPKRQAMRDWSAYYSQELLSVVSQRERHLLDAYELGFLWAA